MNNMMVTSDLENTAWVATTTPKSACHSDRAAGI